MRETGNYPVFHCSQEIPCDPCTTACPKGLIQIPGDDIRGLPVFLDQPGAQDCIGCEQCVTICPGLAISLVNYTNNGACATVSVAYEMPIGALHAGDAVTALDANGDALAEVKVSGIRKPGPRNRTAIVRLEAPVDIAKQVAGFRTGSAPSAEIASSNAELLDDDAIVCRCERVTAGEIRAQIRAGCRDLNELKAVTRAGMGACGGKTCEHLVLRLFREEGVPPQEIVLGTRRPVFVEVPLGAFAGVRKQT
jgi:ferredoxin